MEVASEMRIKVGLVYWLKHRIIKRLRELSNNQVAQPKKKKFKS